MSWILHRPCAPACPLCACVCDTVPRSCDRGNMISQMPDLSQNVVHTFAADRPVYLDISIKVAPKWRRDEGILEQYGY